MEEEKITSRYLTNEILKELFESTPEVPEKYIFQATSNKKAKKNFKSKLRDDKRFWNSQKWTYHTKEKRSAKCQSCKIVLQIGVKC